MSATLSTHSVPNNMDSSSHKRVISRHRTPSQFAAVAESLHESAQALQKAQPYQHKYSTRIAPNISPLPGPSQDGGASQGETPTIAYMRPNSLRSPQACDACRRRKVRCVVPSPPPPGAGHVDGEPGPKVCNRCTRMSLQCVWGDARRGRQRNSIPPRTAQEGSTSAGAVAQSEDMLVLLFRYSIGI
jgi:hypothetical protein